MPDIADDVDEFPIIFNEWSINRILAGEKTQTRRVIDFSKFDPLGQMDMSPGKFEFEQLKDGRSAHFREPNGAAVVHCPYGQPGDVLWVREAFRLPSGVRSTPKEYVRHCEGRTPVVRYEADESSNTDRPAYRRDWNGTLKPAIHMPRELCRLRLRIEVVRVERVQEISLEDCVAEGIDPQGLGYKNGRRHAEPSFKPLWNEIHGDGAWEENPWVWVVEFSRNE